MCTTQAEFQSTCFLNEVTSTNKIMNDCQNWSLQFLDHIARYINLCPVIGDQEFSFLLVLKSFTYSDIILRARKDVNIRVHLAKSQRSHYKFQKLQYYPCVCFLKVDSSIFQMSKKSKEI